MHPGKIRLGTALRLFVLVDTLVLAAPVAMTGNGRMGKALAMDQYVSFLFPFFFFTDVF
jgi:hypothetical protein